jgi:hypothetical protein
MPLPTASVLGRLSSRNSHRNHLITIVITGGVILVFLFILLTIALPALDGHITEDDSSYLELGSIAWYLNHVLASAVPFGLELAVLFCFLRWEHLRAHIGEKRLSVAQMPALGKISFHTGLFRTALFSSVVLFVRSTRPLIQEKTFYPVFVRDRSTRSCSKKARPYFIPGGSQLCDGLCN